MQPDFHLRVLLLDIAGMADSISRWNAYARMFMAGVKPLYPNHLHEN